MRRSLRDRGLRDSRAQAAVELVVALPLILLVMFAGWQLVVAGHTWWKVGEAARLGARARYVAEQRGDAAAGLRRGRQIADGLLASSPARSRSVVATKQGAVEVRARVPLVGPFRAALGADGGPRVTARSRMAP